MACVDLIQEVAFKLWKQYHLLILQFFGALKDRVALNGKIVMNLREWKEVMMAC